ncbi:MAG: hypothetical protein LBB88_11960 [Planctomycetaceae bacterium]|jgi:hypothetical protein|nr:hypothetical protein [Planctomycetaceae bacterium]
MSEIRYPFYYLDGTEICLGDTVIYENRIFRIERIFEPNSKGAIIHDIPEGCIILYGKYNQFQDQFMAISFDHPDILDPNHQNYIIRFYKRATLWYHIDYSWWHLKKFVNATFPIEIWEVTWRECWYFHFKYFMLSLCELFQAIIFGPGKNVRQLIHS